MGFLAFNVFRYLENWTMRYHQEMLPGSSL